MLRAGCSRCADFLRRCCTSGHLPKRCRQHSRRSIPRSRSRTLIATCTNRRVTRSPRSRQSCRMARCCSSTTGFTTAAIPARVKPAPSASSSRRIRTGAPCSTTSTRRSAIRSSFIDADINTHVKVQHLIIGAGPTGLGAAWRLQQRGIRDWALLEGGCVAGGLAQSVVDDHGFTWDLGGHVQFSHYEMFDQLMDDLLGADGWLYHDRESWVWIAGRFVPYPFQLNLHRLPESERAACLRGLDEAAMAASRSSRAPENFGEWIDRTFGAGIADVFMRPYNRKVWARDPELMDWRWIGDRVAVADVARVKENLRLHRDDVSWGPNNRFRFPRHGGTGAVWQALARQLTQHGLP